MAVTKRAAGKGRRPLYEDKSVRCLPAWCGSPDRGILAADGAMDVDPRRSFHSADRNVRRAYHFLFGCPRHRYRARSAASSACRHKGANLFRSGDDIRA